MAGSSNPFLDLVEGRAPEGWTIKYHSLNPLHVEASHPNGGFISYCNTKEDPMSYEELIRRFPDAGEKSSNCEIGKITNIRFIK